jgi:predicted hydrocarbon binding protein
MNLQKTLEDTLGEEGVHLLFQSAEESNYLIFRYLVDQYSQIKTAKSKLEMAATLFQYCGLGVIHFQTIDISGGRIISPSSHHVTGWLAKYGRRHTPGCHFTRGWIAGIMAAIYDRSPGDYVVEETTCKMMRAPECVFNITVHKS